ncbi:PadR family transcriptional regulator [Embleya sp. NPDC020886]|uniref:PadR family transcriptional regulator n=1 Tax=Embleya sp. NPDC020886 TaxID=3363980 RepID=UPI003789BD6F
MTESAPLPPLTETGWTALGFIVLQPRSGYEIKQAALAQVDAFWGVSYAQLYPQLKQLQDLGLTEPLGASGPRNQTIWQATDAGRAALHDWLAAPPGPPRLRDEALLKLTFVDTLSSTDALALIAHKRREFLGWIAYFESEAGAATRPLLRAYGLGQARAGLTWCDHAATELAGGSAPG